MYSRWTAITEAAKQRCRPHDNYYRPYRLFHTLKAIVCLLLGRRRSLWPGECLDAVAVYGFHDHHYPGCECSGGADWIELSVGYGLLDWHYDIYENSSC